jgi:hypothetical protein
MSKRYVHNPTAGPIFAGGVLIPPGEGREVDKIYLPPEAGAEAEAEAPAVPDPDASLRELLANPVKDVLPELAGFSNATLDRLAELEGQDATPRKTLLAAIGELKLERAKVTTEAGSEGGTPD